ncbi:MAG: M20/M25/M40 family metallo-hydrolase [Candidatus Acidiferrales bacterium]
MSLRRSLALLPPLCVFAALLPAAAQISPTEPDPLSRIRAAASAQGCSATGESLCAEASPKIIADALGPSPLEENLRRLTDEIGGRMSGSPQMTRAVDWAVRAFRDAGVDVHTESYTLPLSWSEGATRLDVLSPEPVPVRLVSVGWSPPTPAGGIEASVVFAGEGTEEDFARLGERGRGAILLVHSEVLHTWSDLFEEYERAPGIIDRAVKAQAAGILWMSTRERLLLYRHQNTLTGQLDRLPQAIVAREDALRLERFLEEGQAVRVRWDMPNHVGPAVEQQNVVAEIRGREKPDEAVILGAHLDSWELGTGALDNGCNAAMVIEVARDIRATGLVPRRTIRFILFSGEEQGMLGSWAYVRAHRDEMDRIRGVVIFDEGIGRVTGFSLGGRRDIESGVREATKPLEGWGVDENTYDAPLGTDNFDFLLEGVPNLIANQEEANYIPNYHAVSDTFDKVDIRELKLHAAIAGVTVFGIAESVAPLGPRLSRAELETLLQQTGLDAQMKAAGIWPLWESGQRGRQP